MFPLWSSALFLSSVILWGRQSGNNNSFKECTYFDRNSNLITRGEGADRLITVVHRPSPTPYKVFQNVFAPISLGKKMSAFAIIRIRLPLGPWRQGPPFLGEVPPPLFPCHFSNSFKWMFGCSVHCLIEYGSVWFPLSDKSLLCCWNNWQPVNFQSRIYAVLNLPPADQDGEKCIASSVACYTACQIFWTRKKKIFFITEHFTIFATHAIYFFTFGILKTLSMFDL